jgi:hypothetical protein
MANAWSFQLLTVQSTCGIWISISSFKRPAVAYREISPNRSGNNISQMRNTRKLVSSGLWNRQHRRLNSHKQKLPKSGGFGSLLFLHQHPHWIFQKLCQLLHEPGALRSIAHAVIYRDSGFHAPAHFNLTTFGNNRHFARRTNC